MLPAGALTFDEKRYDRQSFHPTKTEARKRAESWRKRGHNARVVPVPPFKLQAGPKAFTARYAVYVL